MYRFLLRPRWLAFHLLVVVGVVAMVNLGFWQLRRLDERQAFNAVIEARYDATPVPLADLVTPGLQDVDSVEWRPAVASGTYLPDESLLVVNRSQNGRAGLNAVVPLRLAGDQVVLVNRGFVPLTDVVPPIPAVDVDVTGRIRASEERRFGQVSDAAEGELDEVQRLDLDRLAAQFDDRLLPVYLDLIESAPAETGPFPEPVEAPDLSEGNHLSYAVQWFVFSAAAVVGWFLAVRASARSRQRKQRTRLEADSVALEDGHPPELLDDVGRLV